MLPILNKKKSQTGVIVQQRAPDSKPEQNQEDSSGLEIAAKDLLNAVEAKDIKGIAEALKAAFQIADSEPHEEGEPHSYQAQNIKAGENR